MLNGRACDKTTTRIGHHWHSGLANICISIFVDVTCHQARGIVHVASLRGLGSRCFGCPIAFAVSHRLLGVVARGAFAVKRILVFFAATTCVVYLCYNPSVHIWYVSESIVVC